MAERQTTTGALVLGASYRSLGVARSLGRSGIPVWLVRTSAHTIARHSRYARGLLPWPEHEDEHGRVAHLLALAHEHALDDWTLIPTDDETAALVSRFHAQLGERYRVAVPEWTTLRWAYDKRLTHELALKAGVDEPRTWIATTEGFRDDDVCFPAILKPAFKRERNRFTHAKAWPVRDRDELESAFRAASALVAPEEILLQELIPGDGRSQLSFAGLAQDGKVIASLTACRARQYPMDFGRESTFVYTIDLPDVESAALRVIDALGYSGLLEVEFKRDARDGKPKLLDINPRVWGWHSLGPRAGVDFVALQWRLLHGETLAPVRARSRVGWMRGSTDTLTCVRELSAGRLAPGYLASLRRPLERAMFALDDPLPGLLDVPLLAVYVTGVGTRSLLRRTQALPVATVASGDPSPRS